jgi:predicted sugar kinase
MAKKKKKDLNIHIDTKNIDLDIVRKDGKTTINYDSPNLDIQAEKTEDGLKVDVQGTGKIAEKAEKIIRRIVAKRG